MIKILALDDDQEFHTVLKVKLNSSEIQLVHCLEEEVFFEKFNEQKFDLILLDLSLSSGPLKGLDILTMVKAADASIPVLVLSSADSSPIISHALELGASGFLNKPLNGGQLVSKIKELVLSGDELKVKVNFEKAVFSHPTVTTSVQLRIKGVTELGFIAEGSGFVTKGSKVLLSSWIIREILDVDAVEVVSAGFTANENSVYTTQFEIAPDEKELIHKCKEWLTLKLNN